MHFASDGTDLIQSNLEVDNDFINPFTKNVFCYAEYGMDVSLLSFVLTNVIFFYSS